MSKQHLTSKLATRAHGLGFRDDKHEGIYLGKAKGFEDIPKFFRPRKVIHAGQETQIRIRTQGGEYPTLHGPREFYGVQPGVLVSETGLFMFAYGLLVRITQNGETWFEVCVPEHFKHFKPKNGILVPSAELYVNGDVPVLTTSE